MLCLVSTSFKRQASGDRCSRFHPPASSNPQPHLSTPPSLSRPTSGRTRCGWPRCMEGSTPPSRWPMPGRSHWVSGGRSRKHATVEWGSHSCWRERERHNKRRTQAAVTLACTPEFTPCHPEAARYSSAHLPLPGGDEGSLLLKKMGLLDQVRRRRRALIGAERLLVCSFPCFASFGAR